MNQFIVIDKPSHLTTYASEMGSFFKLYIQNFPDPDEREDPDIICNRIKMIGGKPHDPETTILLSLLNDQVSGGAVLEYYSECACFLLTYILVNENFRGKNVARNLIESGIKTIIESKGEGVKALFFESNIPWETNNKKDPFDAWDRYRIFSKLGAKWLDLDYTQPALGEGKKKVDHLHLFLFPSITNLKGKISINVVRSFLTVFYKSLGIHNPEADPDFIRMEHSLSGDQSDGFILLKEVPSQEQRIFLFEDVSVAYHFNEDPTENIKMEKPGNMLFCPIIGSYEFDLFKFRYQNNPPYKTYCLNSSPVLKCDILFPEMTTYLSEGRYQSLKDFDGKICIEIKLNYTVFSNGRKIWTVVLIPQKGYPISEDQIIKLIALFSRSPEQSNILSQTRFVFKDIEYESLELMVRAATNVPALELIQSGILQTEFSSSKRNLTGSGPELWKDIIEAICRISRNQESAYQQLEKRYLEEKEVQQVLNLMCGFSLGIFDYSRMSFEEVMDTILPLSTSGNSFILMNKGILNSLNYGDDIYLRTRSTLGICPYLLIASMVLAFNDVEATIAETRLNHLLDPEIASRTSLQVMISHRKTLEKKVNEEILSNVFHYPTEQNIFIQGMVHRGVDDRITSIKSRLNELIQLIKDKDSKQKSKYDKMGVILLAVISILSLEPVFSDIYQSLSKAEEVMVWMKDEGVMWISFFVFSLAVFLFIRNLVMKSIKEL